MATLDINNWLNSCFDHHHHQSMLPPVGHRAATMNSCFDRKSKWLSSQLMILELDQKEFEKFVCS